MFKKRTVKGAPRQKVIRRESSDGSSSDSEDDSVVLKKVKKSDSNESSISKQTPDGKTEDDEDNDKQLTQNNEITKVDALNQEIIDKDRIRKAQGVEEKDAKDDGIYKGQSNYATFIRPSAGQAMDKIGPKKASANIRSTTVFDFQRDVCKDYKQTGFCGYGDSCKFLHARDDFKAGWKLNKEWDLGSKEKKEKMEKELGEIPFKCPICKNDYKSPIKTNCNHYFCESCFLKRSKKNPNCLICEKNTNSVAHPAKNLQQLLKK